MSNYNFFDNKFSDKEIQMFSQTGLPDIEYWLKYSTPRELYERSIWFCFSENKTGRAVESLRRCAHHWMNDDFISRNTKEWDSLIELE